LQGDQLAVVGRQIVLRGLQIVQRLGDARFQLTQGERASVLRVSSSLSTSLRAFRLRRLAHVFRRLRHLLTKLRVSLNAFNFIQRFQRLGQILLDQFVLRRVLFACSACRAATEHQHAWEYRCCYRRGPRKRLRRKTASKAMQKQDVASD
jgi:hypothetical protein